MESIYKKGESVTLPSGRVLSYSEMGENDRYRIFTERPVVIVTDAQGVMHSFTALDNLAASYGVDTSNPEEALAEIRRIIEEESVPSIPDGATVPTDPFEDIQAQIDEQALALAELAAIVAGEEQ